MPLTAVDSTAFAVDIGDLGDSGPPDPFTKPPPPKPPTALMEQVSLLLEEKPGLALVNLIAHLGDGATEATRALLREGYVEKIDLTRYRSRKRFRITPQPAAAAEPEVLS